MNITINPSRKLNMKKIYILLAIMLLCQQAYAATNEFVMKPTSFTVAGDGGKYSFNLTCDRYLGPLSTMSDIIEMNVKGFEFISYEDSGGQVDSIRCIFPAKALLEGSFIIFKPNTTPSAISGTITIHHYTLFRGKPQEERTLVATYTQQPGIIPPPPLEITNGNVENSFIDETGTKKNQTITYYDAFRRPIQTIHVGASPSGKDIVNFIEYDEMGRSDSKSYLPYPIRSITAGAKRSNPQDEQRKYYVAQYDNNGEFPYAVKRYESGGMLSAQGGVGLAQHISLGFHSEFESRPNLSTDLIKKLTVVNDSILAYNDYFPDSTLIVKRKVSFSSNDKTNSMTTDIYEYYDSNQQLIAKEERISLNDRRITYYVYDEMGMQRYIIPLIQSEILSVGYHTPYSLRKYCYYNEYDEYGRLSKQHVPGADYSVKLYDNRGRLAMTQNGNQRDKNQWSFTKYDAFDRPVLSGIYTGGTYDTHRTALQSQTIMYERRGNAVHGYTNDTYPSVTSEADYLIISYYDDYEWLPNLRPFLAGVDYFNFSVEDALGEQKTEFVNGATTGTKVKVLGTDSNQWLTTVNYYNDQGKMIQSFAELFGPSIVSGVEIISNKYDFQGQVTQAKVKQVIKNTSLSGADEYEYGKWYTYDDQGRLQKIEFQITGDTKNGKVILAEYAYDDMGRMSTKYIHNGQDSTVQKYNIGGQCIDSQSDIFSYELSYYDNGNLSQSLWSVSNDSIAYLGYGYAYDRYGQLTAATPLKLNRVNPPSFAILTKTNNYAEKNISYDKNGNILTLVRTNSSGNELQNIAYGYNGNQLESIRIRSGNTSITGFQYDSNGNMIYDPLENIHIEYNSFDLPEKIFDGSNEINYIYTSAGDKVGKKAGSSFTYYRGMMVYADSDLLYILHPEGTVSKTSGGYTYNYFKKDYANNVRIFLSAVNGVLQEQQSTDYYPFGVAWQYNNLNKNKYLFSGKEFQTDAVGTSHILGMYDFGARYYNPVLGRWSNIDPKLQGCNPYVFCGNNPVMHIDPNGELWWLAPMISGGLFNLHSQAMLGNIHNFWDGLLAFGVGGASSVAGAGIGGVAAKFANDNNILGFRGGFFTGFSSGFGSGFITGLGNSAMNGNGFTKSLGNGFMTGLTAGLSNGLLSGLNDGLVSLERGYSFWDGSKTYDIISDPSIKNIAERIVKNPPNSIFENADIRLHPKVFKYFGLQQGDYGAKIMTTKPPTGYKLLVDGAFLNKSGQITMGAFKSFYNGTGSLHVSLAALDGSEIVFKATVGHEFIHAYHNMKGLLLGQLSEAVAYRYTIKTYLDAGMNTKAMDILQIAKESGYLCFPPIEYRMTPFISF